jgi:hypothetical protein
MVSNIPVFETLEKVNKQNNSSFKLSVVWTALQAGSLPSYHSPAAITQHSCVDPTLNATSLFEALGVRFQYLNLK